MRDWAYTQTFKFYCSAKAFMKHRLQDIRPMICGGREELPVSASMEYQELRLRVLQAACFIEAHQFADRNFKQLIDNLELSSPDNTSTQRLADAMDAVLEESEMQVKEAQKVLELVSTTEMDMLMSHYM